MFRNDDDARRRRRELLALLTAMRDQRAKIRLEFEEGVTTLRGISGTLVDFDAAGLHVEVSSLGGVSLAFQGAQLSCFFHVRGKEGREQFLAFDTTVIRMGMGPRGVVEFVLEVPQAMRPAQLRRSVRVRVDARKVPEFALWGEIRDRIPGGPPLFGPEDLAAGRLSIVNMSANGLRLSAANDLMHRVLPGEAKNARHSMRFLAVSEPGAKPVEFWVTAVLRNIFSDPQSGKTEMGFEFVTWGVREKSGLSWKPLRFDEVPGLGKFIFKWNLDLYREKGLGQ